MESIELRHNVTPRTEAALVYAAGLTGETVTDTVCRSAQLWAALVEHRAKGGRIILVDADGDAEELTLITGPAS